MFRVYDYLGLFLDNLERQFDWKLARSMAIFRIFIFGRSFYLKLYGYFLTNQKFFSTFSWLLMTPDLSFTYPLFFQIFRSVIPCLTNSQTFFQVWGPLVFFVSFFHKNSSVLDFEKFCFLHHFLFHFYIKNDAKANEIAKTKFLKNPTI